ncbi:MULTISPECIES: hypothetical protein [unclassified Streptomyces]|uniref:hypothetical protein n=1 Tax=unclassified Streptomyces TaxID=2593676 RepID=UPI00225AB48C|nr:MULTISPECIES: hypothetical protein [unclassified Streptomyces]MCX4524495.1 hypothetical protein [Streptomyces sp. NBC_01551]MCX4544981.1 hypothetical protein [Streptomyces sp. NBC_01565]
MRTFETVTREENSALATALAPAPPEPSEVGRSCLGTVLILASIGIAIWGAVAGKWFDRESARRLVAQGNGDARLVVDPPHTHLAWIAGAALVLGVLLVLVDRLIDRRYARRAAAGRGPADRVWSAGWYCGRCGMVHVSGEPALSLLEFRSRVWEAAGFGAQARKRPIA